jgi:hypothetical protein
MQKQVLQVMFQLRFQTLLWIWSQTLNLSTYSELYAAYQYLVPLCVTQVDCERRFLTLKFILRNNIGQEKLEALMLTYMHKQMINDISNELIINQFANSSLALRRLLIRHEDIEE